MSVQLSIKYGGAVPWRHRYMSTASLNRTRSVTSSQWSSSCISRDKPLSYFRERKCLNFSFQNGTFWQTLHFWPTVGPPNVAGPGVANPPYPTLSTGLSRPDIHRLPDTTNLSEMKEAGIALTAETCFSRLKSDDIITLVDSYVSTGLNGE